MNQIIKSMSSLISGTARMMTLLLAASALLAGCGSAVGTMNSSNPGTVTPAACANCGGALVTLTDAPGDFLSYIVDVVSVQLKRADGTLVEIIPVTTKVDFAQLVNLSEIISASQIPAGRYVSASVTLDYASAVIVVDNGTSGVTIAPGNIINGVTSMPLSAPNPTQVTLTLTLDVNHQFAITEHAIANLALDFNLAASNAVTPSPTNPTTVTVNPVLTGSLVPDATKQIRVRGPLVSVDTVGNSFIVSVEPFFNQSGENGQVTVGTTSTTTYSINGTSYSGTAGLTQLATLAAGTKVASFGTWDTTAQTFTASSVLAGSSVTGNKSDGGEGTVLSRTGNTFTLANCVFVHADRDDPDYMRQVTVTVAAATAVTEQGQSGAFSIQDISVGQHVQVSGTLSSDGAGNATLDATAGSVRLLPTNLSGTVGATAANLVTVILRTLDGRPASIFNFAGTGTSTATDALATAYTVSVPAALSTSSLTTGAPVRFTGFVSPFAAAPPDFTASTLVSYADTRAELRIRWMPTGEIAPFTSLTSAQLSISQATLKASAVEIIRIAFQTFDPAAPSTGLQLVPDAAFANPSFSIGHSTSARIDSYATFADFVTALTADLNGKTAAVQINAEGPYAAATGVMSVDRMVVILND